MNITECGIYIRDDKFNTTSGIVNLHPTKGTHWVMYRNQNYFDFNGCPPPLNITKKLIMVSIQDIKFRKMIVIVQRTVYMFYISHKLKALNCSFKFILSNFQT